MYLFIDTKSHNVQHRGTKDPYLTHIKYLNCKRCAPLVADNPAFTNSKITKA